MKLQRLGQAYFDCREAIGSKTETLLPPASARRCPLSSPPLQLRKNCASPIFFPVIVGFFLYLIIIDIPVCTILIFLIFFWSYIYFFKGCISLSGTNPLFWVCSAWTLKISLGQEKRLTRKNSNKKKRLTTKMFKKKKC